MNPPGPVPDGEALRQAMLLASWRRDRRVRLRRTAWRWFLWGLWRYGLPVVAGALAVVWVAAYTLERFAAPPAAPPRMPARVAPAPAPSVAGASSPAAPAAPDPDLQHDNRLHGKEP